MDIVGCGSLLLVLFGWFFGWLLWVALWVRLSSYGEAGRY